MAASAFLRVLPAASLIKEKEKQKMNPALIRLIIMAVEAACVLIVTAVTIKDSVKKKNDKK